MKTLITALCLALALTVPALAQDGMPVLTEQNIQKFIQVMPKYQSLIKEYGEDYSPEEAIPVSSKLGNEINALLSRHGLSMQEFPLLAQKISMAFAALQMEQTDMGPMAGMFAGMPQFNNISPAEKTLVKKYAEQIKQVFDVE